MKYYLNNVGALMVGHKEHDEITPEKDVFKICAKGEKCFSIVKERELYTPEDIRYYVALKPNEYYVKDSEEKTKSQNKK